MGLKLILFGLLVLLLIVCNAMDKNERFNGCVDDIEE